MRREADAGGLRLAVEEARAAEMASATNGLGYLTWNAYVNHSLPGIIIGMLSIGFAGMASSAIVIWLGRRAMPWQNRK